MPSFTFKPPFPDFPPPAQAPGVVVDDSDDNEAASDVTDADVVVTTTGKLAAAVVSDNETEVTSEEAEVFTSGQARDGMSGSKEVSTLTGEGLA